MRHIIVCGHYGCGGVKTALKQNELGLLNNWLYGVGELSRRHQERLDALPDRNHRIDALCEFNVIEQVRNVCRNPILLQAWRRGQEVSVHAWIYDLTNGRLKDLDATVDGERYAELDARRRDRAAAADAPFRLESSRNWHERHRGGVRIRVRPVGTGAARGLRGLRPADLRVSMGFLLFFNRRPDVARWTPVGPYFASISVIFALFLAFHGRTSCRTRPTPSAASSMPVWPSSGSTTCMSPDQLNLPGPRAALAHYVGHVFRDEWRSMRNSRPSTGADQAFRDVQQQVIAAETRLPPASAGQLHALLGEVARTRSDRLWVGGAHTETTSWLAVLLLGLLTHLAIASIHFDRPRAGTIALGLLACTATVAYWSLAIVNNPYRLMDNLDPSRWLPMAI